MDKLNRWLDFKAINIAILIYASLFALWVFIQKPIYEYGLLSPQTVFWLAPIYARGIVFIAGYVCGRLAKNSGFYNGVAVGVISQLMSLAGVTVLFGFDLTSEWHKFNPVAMLIPITLAGIGGALGQIWPKKKTTK